MIFTLNFFATCPKGLESLLAKELEALGAIECKETRAGVYFTAEAKAIYPICLWSRLANHILLVLLETEITNWDDLYQAALDLAWDQHMTADNSFAIDVDMINSPLKNSLFAMQKFKDGLVDYWRNKVGRRPSVVTKQPDLRFHLLIKNQKLSVSLNLSGDSLHKRNYRSEGGFAPLKENLAAAILLRANWPSIAKQGGSLFDPLCGSGTLLIEGALMAADMAPGLQRHYFGFLKWQEFSPITFKNCVEDAKQRALDGIKNMPRIMGFDGDAYAVNLALANIKRVGLSDYIHVERRELARVEALTIPPGLLVTNPPYGERLGEKETLKFTYQHLGELFKQHFSDWRCSVFTGNPELAKALRLGPENIYRLFNGAIACQLLNFIIHKKENRVEKLSTPAVVAPSEGLDFANRLKKNLTKLESLAKKQCVSCYRVYDADLPDYAVAIDRYEDVIHVQEYAPPKTIDPEKAKYRLELALMHIKHIFALDDKKLFLKTRQKQKGLSQYEKQNQLGKFHTVLEGKAKLLVNFTDYLDTGLFLDSRSIRQWIFDHAQGKTFLNLFCYTGSATVFAALGKASKTTSIDMSATYLEWAKRNLALNGFSEAKHSFVQADCFKWLSENKTKFDLILLDPPTFSNSKRMEKTLDIQRDHAELICLAMQHLNKNGTLIFVTNKHNFKLAEALSQEFLVKDISKQTLPFDFQRYAIHQAFLLTCLQK